MPYKNKDKQRKAQREWARRNRGTINRNSKKSRRKTAQLVIDHKDCPCADCGETYPYYVMDLDHLPGHDKVMGVSDMVGKGLSKASILAELEKCEVVCANCHRERTHSGVTI